MNARSVEPAAEPVLHVHTSFALGGDCNEKQHRAISRVFVS